MAGSRGRGGWLIVIALAACGAAWSADAEGPSWNSLSPSQKAALAPLQRDWNSIDATGKQRWLEVGARLPSMPPSERARMQERMSDWTRLTPQQRAQARLQFQEARQLSPQERQTRWEAYQALPPERREELARRPVPPPPRRGVPREDVTPKSNVVPNPNERAAAKPVSPTVVQTGPGATTRLLTQRPTPPRHQQTGLPKIAATPGFVDSTTLLPKRGPQGAATQPAPAAANAPKRQK
jgi:hypothetical protein